jgi:hypothetical protein
LFVLKERGMPYAVTVALDSPAAKAGVESGTSSPSCRAARPVDAAVGDLADPRRRPGQARSGDDPPRRSQAAQLPARRSAGAAPEVVERDGVAMLRSGAFDGYDRDASRRPRCARRWPRSITARCSISAARPRAIPSAGITPSRRSSPRAISVRS